MQKHIKTQIQLHKEHDFHHPPVMRIVGLMVASIILFYVASLGFHSGKPGSHREVINPRQVFAEFLTHEKETHRHIQRLDTCLRLPTVSGTS